MILMCDDCNRSTSGNCGRHGAMRYEVSVAPADLLAPEERATVERLRIDPWDERLSDKTEALIRIIDRLAPVPR